VDQRDIGRVNLGQDVHLRLDALPQRTFVGRVTSIGQLPADSGAEVRYPVRASVANPNGVLKPQMAAYARVLTAPASAMDRLLRAPVRWARLLWWKVRG
jgi:multidrug efflux pump subunit AcrA (membrane-fusion protein)